MYSISVRFNAIFFNFGICLAILAGFNVLTTVFIEKQPIVKKFEYITDKTYNNPYTKVQHSNGKLKMDIDYSPLFNWNSNLIFSWISATYETKTPKGTIVQTSVTIWDRIMKRYDYHRHHVIYDNEPIFYPLISSNFDLKGKNVTLELHWEHMPVVGFILKKKIPLGKVHIPESSSSTPDRRTIVREIDYEVREEQK